MDAISQTPFSNAFSLMKIFEFRLKFHWSLFLSVQLTLFQHWFRWWLGAVQATSHYLNQWWSSQPTHICVTRPQWVNSSPPSATYMRQWIGSALVEIMACRLFAAKPLSKPRLDYCQLDPKEQTSVKFQSNYKIFHSRKCIWKYRLPTWRPFCPGGDEIRIEVESHDKQLNTLRPRQMDAISQTTFSNAFSWMKMFEFRLKFHWSLFPRVKLTIFQHWFR